MTLIRKPIPEEGPTRDRAPMRVWHATELPRLESKARRRAENVFIVTKYREAIEDASQGGIKPTQRAINERLGL